MDEKILYQSRLKVFFIGIGGVSMSGLAKLLLSRGYDVCGSDKRKTGATKELERLGVKVFYTHAPSNLNGAHVVVYSAAIGENNPELKFAIANGVKVVKRSQLVAEILKEFKRTVAISGCHGKTTSTAMLGEIMKRAGQSPTVLLGGEYPDYGNLLTGEGDLAIAEACEYKKSFLDINTKIVVVLNIDNDHLDSFDGINDVVASFKKFVGGHLAVINADDKYANEISNCTTVTFGIDNVATYYAKDIKQTQEGISFTAYAYAKAYGQINLKIQGKHNVYNALAAFAVADMLGAPFYAVKKGLEAFKGVKRRNELIAQRQGVKYYADYAHHPSELKATLDSIKQSNEQFITVFQPHTYSRTKILMNDFVSVFSGLENIIIYKSYSARERFDKRGSAKALSEKININTPCLYAHTEKELKNHLDKLIAENGKIKRVIFLGAGDIYSIAIKLLRLNQKV